MNDTGVYKIALSQALEEQAGDIDKALRRIEQDREVLWLLVRKRETNLDRIHEAVFTAIEGLDLLKDLMIDIRDGNEVAARIAGPHNKKRPPVVELLQMLGYTDDESE